jgi:hypothetical protein
VPTTQQAILKMRRLLMACSCRLTQIAADPALNPHGPSEIGARGGGLSPPDQISLFISDSAENVRAWDCSPEPAVVRDDGIVAQDKEGTGVASK